MKTFKECKDEVARFPHYGYENWDDMESDSQISSFLEERMNEMAAELYANQSKWISVKERLPETNDGVLATALIEGGNQLLRGYIFYNSGSWFWTEDQQDKVIGEITFWQPLPSPPSLTD